MSSGLRLVTRLPSTTTSSSTQLPPALRDVRLDAPERRQRCVARDVGLDEHPRRVADGRDRLACVEELADELHGVLVGPHCVRVADPAGKDERVVVVRARILDGAVDRERVRLVVVVEPLDLALLERHQVDLAARVLHSLPRLRQLDLLDHVGCKERDFLPLQISHFGDPLESDSPRLYPRSTEGNPSLAGGVEPLLCRHLL